MLRRSLTAKILVAVGVTVAVVIAIYTYFVIQLQSAWWRDRTQAQNLISTTLVREYLEGVMLSERHDEVTHFLDQLKKSQEILRGRIIAPDGRIVFSTEPEELKQTYYRTPPELFDEDRILQGTRNEKRQNLAVAIAPVFNRPSCSKCHDQQKPSLGAIVLEKSMAPAEANITGNRNLLIVYGLVILVLVGIVLWLLVVRLVSQPVDAVLRQMRRVKEGDLAARAEPDSNDEIGELAHGFNAMVQSLDTTRRELHESHEKQIQQAGRLASIGELASGIAHEIRNPLAGIGAAVEVLVEGGPIEQSGEIVQEIHQQVNRLNSTLRSLLDFARQREPDIAPCDAHDLIKPMLALARPQALKSRIETIEEYASDLPLLCVDAQLAQQAILNILVNAVQAMPDGGTLTVRVGAETKSLIEGHDRVVSISVSDTGAGIAPENLQKIFSPFFTTKHRGTGLGLAITSSIIEKHHGAIRVESKLGHGTTFILEFPACAPGAPPCSHVRTVEPRIATVKDRS